MANEEKQEKKIIIDEDWKHEAQREKEVLAAKEAAEKQKAAAHKRPPGPLPRGDFAALISMLVTQALYALGALEIQGNESEKREPDLGLAKYNIDILETLQEKTKGNLTEQESKVLENMLGQVRMAYVNAAKQ